MAQYCRHNEVFITLEKSTDVSRHFVVIRPIWPQFETSQGFWEKKSQEANGILYLYYFTIQVLIIMCVLVCGFFKSRMDSKTTRLVGLNGLANYITLCTMVLEKNQQKAKIQYCNLIFDPFFSKKKEGKNGNS